MCFLRRLFFVGVLLCFFNDCGGAGFVASAGFGHLQEMDFGNSIVGGCDFSLHCSAFKTKKHRQLADAFLSLVWSHLGLNQGPPDYESGATNQLSYGTCFFVSGCKDRDFFRKNKLFFYGS